MIEIANNTWIINTELTLLKVSKIYKQYSKNLKELKSEWIINFANCQKLDSSGLALIIEYIKYAKKNNIQLKLKNLNSDSISLASVHGTKHILEPFL